LEDPESSLAARVLDSVVPYILSAAVFFSLLQTVDPCPVPVDVCTVMDLVIEAVFTVEVLVRYMTSPVRGAVFFLSVFNMIDIVAALPLIARVVKISVSSTGLGTRDGDYDVFLLCVVPILRLLKMMRRFQKIHLLLGAFQLALEALPVLMFTLALITLSFASLIYLVEPRDNFEGLPKAIWFTIVTMTTVGYGDVTPSGSAGHCIVAILTVSSVLYMAMPLGIVGQAFTQVWSDRDRILLVKKARAALLQWGYSAADLPVLCKMFDTSGRGELNCPDFCRMIRMMRIGLKNERMIDLFDAFDADGSGCVDDRELVRQLFPHSYHELYDKADQDGKIRGPQPSPDSEFDKNHQVIPVEPDDDGRRRPTESSGTSVVKRISIGKVAKSGDDDDDGDEKAIMNPINQDLIQEAAVLHQHQVNEVSDLSEESQR
jgi:voltage-gated potassium channel Kch